MGWTVVPFDKKLAREHFDCGTSSLNDYIRRYVSQDIGRGLTKAYAAVEGPDNVKVIGYYTVSSAQVACQEVPELWRKRAGVYPVPCSRIGRLAVDKSARGKGLGAYLLMHAYETIKQAGSHIGIKAVIVEAEDASAESFYRKYGFHYLQATPPTPGKRTLFLPLTAVRPGVRDLKI